MGGKRAAFWRKLTALALAAAMWLGTAGMAGGATDQMTAALTLTEQGLDENSGTIRLLLEQCLALLDEDDPTAQTLRSILILMDNGTADAASVSALLRAAIGQQQTAAPAQDQTPEAPAQPTAEPAPQATEPPVPQPTQTSPAAALGLPVYDAAAFVRTVLRDPVLVDVPGNWGNNASGRPLTSYSPVNDSGAISPAAGTLTISYFPMDGTSETEAFDDYQKNISDMSVTTALTAQDVTAADLPARKIDYTMSVGANQFTCETVCFAYQQMVYTIELMQGQQTAYDYFPMYLQVVDSAQVGTEADVQAALSGVVQPTEAPVAQPTEAPVAQPTEAPVAQPTEQPAALPTEQPAAQPTEQPSGGAGLDIGSFLYQLGGHTYQFPTAVRDIAAEDMTLDRQITIPYDFSSDADMVDGGWTEIVNTQYYYFENALHKEMIGVTNMSGYPVSMQDCMLTALIDTQGSYVDVVLPGGVRVGSPESDILKGFPAFAGMTMDGTAAFRGNELLYACNVRDDGCNGYVLIRNDAPYYSAVSIICDNGVVKEISFECLGSVRAYGVFL